MEASRALTRVPISTSAGNVFRAPRLITEEESTSTFWLGPLYLIHLLVCQQDNNRSTYRFFLFFHLRLLAGGFTIRRHYILFG